MPQNLVAVYARFMLEKRNKRQLRDVCIFEVNGMEVYM